MDTRYQLIKDCNPIFDSYMLLFKTPEELSYSSADYKKKINDLQGKVHFTQLSEEEVAQLMRAWPLFSSASENITHPVKPDLESHIQEIIHLADNACPLLKTLPTLPPKSDILKKYTDNLNSMLIALSNQIKSLKQYNEFILETKKPELANVVKKIKPFIDAQETIFNKLLEYISPKNNAHSSHAPRR